MRQSHESWTSAEHHTTFCTGARQESQDGTLAAMIRLECHGERAHRLLGC
jgi:hypothetical protein